MKVDMTEPFEGVRNERPDVISSPAQKCSLFPTKISRGGSGEVMIEEEEDDKDEEYRLISSAARSDTFSTAE